MKMKDWQIAEAAERGAKSITRLTEELGLKKSEILPNGHGLCKINYSKVLERLAGFDHGSIGIDDAFIIHYDCTIHQGK